MNIMENRKNIVKNCLKKHKDIRKYLIYWDYTSDDFEQLFLKIDCSELQIKLFLLFEGWFPEQVDLIIDFIEKFNKYFLDNDEKGDFKDNAARVIENEKRLFKILVLFSTDWTDDAIIKLRTKHLLEFYKLYIKLVGENDILVLVSFFNQVFTMIQEYIGLTQQFFLCVADSENDVMKYRKYLNGKVPYTLQLCDYYISDFLALFDKTFNYSIDSNSTVLYNRELIFNKLFEIITGQKIDYSNEELNIDSSLKNLKPKIVDEQVIERIIRLLPEIHSPILLCYTYLTGEFLSEELIVNNGLEEIFNEISLSSKRVVSSKDENVDVSIVIETRR